MFMLVVRAKTDRGTILFRIAPLFPVVGMVVGPIGVEETAPPEEELLIFVLAAMRWRTE
jgi:hypothetical protein